MPNVTAWRAGAKRGARNEPHPACVHPSCFVALGLPCVGVAWSRIAVPSLKHRRRKYRGPLGDAAAGGGCVLSQRES